MKITQLIDIFQRARGDKSLAVIEGAQALKHALRFRADVQHMVTTDKTALEQLLQELASDITGPAIKQAREVDKAVFAKLSPQAIRTNVIAQAKRKPYSLKEVAPNRPIIFLEEPKDLENIGAVIRVAAAARAAAVCTTGAIDIWHPAILRGSAGLHFALPVLNIKSLQQIAGPRPVIALDPSGEEDSLDLPANAVFIFGTERWGISQALLGKSDKIVRLPMRPGVSSLNLATSVAALLYKLG